MFCNEEVTTKEEHDYGRIDDGGKKKKVTADWKKKKDGERSRFNIERVQILLHLNGLQDHWKEEEEKYKWVGANLVVKSTK